MNILTPTADGSNTLYNQEIGEHYHSSHGALQESKHVFIAAGLNYLGKTATEINILEVGFGTGLNFLLSCLHTEENKIKLHYTGIEAYPLAKELLEQTGYNQYVPAQIWESFINHYQQCLLEKQELSSLCALTIAHSTLAEFKSPATFDLIYFDAFSVRHQPEMWSNEMIAHSCSFLKVGGVFVTYAITGNLKRALKACGMTLEKLPGAPGKREMLRATKTN